MKLISNTEWGNYCKLKESSYSNRIEYLEWYFKVRSRIDDFMKQPLTLGMFVPCDEDGNVLVEPVKLTQSKERWGTWEITEEWKKYQQTKERVLFEGFEIEGDYLTYSDFYVCMISEIETLTVEDLFDFIPIEEHPTLTQTAIKQLGL